MAWSKVKTKKAYKLFATNLVQSSSLYAEIYADLEINSDRDFDKNQAKESGKRADIYIFSDKKPFVILMAMKRLNQNLGKVLLALPSGDYTEADLPFIAKVILRKYRRYFDRLGITNMIASPLDDYDPDLIDSKGSLLNTLYLKTIPDMMHEFQGAQTGNSGIRNNRKMEFKRIESEKKNDELFTNPRLKRG